MDKKEKYPPNAKIIDENKQAWVDPRIPTEVCTDNGKNGESAEYIKIP